MQKYSTIYISIQNISKKKDLEYFCLIQKKKRKKKME